MKVDEVIARVFRMREVTTEGPWKAVHSGDVYGSAVLTTAGGTIIRTTSYGKMREDAEFIAYSRDMMPKLAEGLKLAMKYLGSHCWEKSCDDPQCNVVRAINALFEEQK